MMNYSDNNTELRYVELDTPYGKLRDVPVSVQLWKEDGIWRSMISCADLLELRPLQAALYKAEVRIEAELNHTEE